MWKAYHSVSSIAEALTLLDEHRGAARIVAGGTDLIIEQERGQHPQLNTLIDITRVPDLDQISLDGDRIVLGPLVTHNHVVASELIRERGAAAGASLMGSRRAPDSQPRHRRRQSHHRLSRQRHHHALDCHGR